MGCHFLSPGDHPDPGIEPGSPALHGKADALPSEPIKTMSITSKRLIPENCLDQMIISQYLSEIRRYEIWGSESMWKVREK